MKLVKKFVGFCRSSVYLEEVVDVHFITGSVDDSCGHSDAGCGTVEGF